jgi:hypothetical protein
MLPWTEYVDTKQTALYDFWLEIKNPVNKKI